MYIFLYRRVHRIFLAQQLTSIPSETHFHIFFLYFTITRWRLNDEDDDADDGDIPFLLSLFHYTYMHPPTETMRSLSGVESSRKICTISH